MRGRTLVILLAVLIILVVVATLFESNRRRATHASGALLFAQLDTEQVDRIRILAKGEETILEKQDDRWLVATEGRFPADAKLVGNILEKLPKFYADEVVSTNPENRARFQVDSTGTEVWIEQGGSEAGHFIVGKPGPDFLSTYVRSAESDRVIQVPEYLPSLFQGRDTWREKAIFTLETDDIQSYEYLSPSRGSLRIARDESGAWQIEAPREGVAEERKVNMVIGAFARLKAISFADTVDAAVAGIEADTTWIRATLADGSTHELTIGGPAEKNRNYVRGDGAEHLVVIPIGGINTMMPPVEFLEPQKAPETTAP